MSRGINDDVPGYIDDEEAWRSKLWGKLGDEDRKKAGPTKPSTNGSVFHALDRLKLGNMADLEHEVFAPLKWAIPDLVPEGLTLLAGKPKVGKSWLALDFAIACASGSYALGNLKCDPGPVLYLGLEDTKRRLQARGRAVLQGAPWPSEMEYKTEWPGCDQSGLADIQTWMECNKSRNARLVVIDTLQKIRGERKRNAGVYEDDYKVIGQFKVLSDKFQIPLVLVTHLNKMGNEDPLLAVTGTAGVTGSADTILVLQREKNDPNAVLYVRGRDVEEAEIAIQFDGQTGKWLRLGKAEDFRVSEERRAIIRALIDHAAPMTPKEIADVIGKKAVNVRQLCHKLHKEGEIGNPTYGKYAV